MKSFIKKIEIFVLFIVFSFCIGAFSVKADDTVELEPLVTSNGSFVYYSGTEENVMLPKEYQFDTYFRSIWVTPLAGNIGSYKNEASYKKEILEIFDVMDYYNLNALIFHIRIMNDALYKSNLNPTSGYLDADWDVLGWIIDECHKRGYEFHAWMNPYRVKSSGGKSVVEEAAKIKAKCPKNVGSDPNNLLINSSGGVILNPGLEVVRQFIVDTCMEVIIKYDVDAIHFDDYFYISGVDDNALYQATNPDGLSLSDWRRHQVNLFIEKLHDTVETFNKANNRYVQIGISPTGIYRNGDGVVNYDENGNAISSGSKTGGQEHYESYLFSDTLKWINEEWIDYILPQSYWAFTHRIAGYADVMSWWNKVVEYKDVNLYSGMGIYMSENPGSNYSWGYDPYESYNQILYASTLKNCDGTVFYNYDYLKYSYRGETGQLYNAGLAAIKKELFNGKAILPVIKSFEPVKLNAPTNITYSQSGSNVEISFDKVEDAKRYIIYRSAENITFSQDQVYDIINAEDLDRIKYVDENVNGKYNYAVKTQSATNHVSEDAAYATFIEFEVKFVDNNGKVLKTEKVNYGGKATAPTITDSNFVGWSRNIEYITSDLVVSPRYKDSDFFVNFYNENGELIETKTTKYKGTVEAPEAKKEGFVLAGWDKDFSEVVYDLDLYPVYEEKICKVVFVDWDDTELLTIEVKYGRSGYYPESPSRRSYEFTGWSESVDEVKDDMVIKAEYKPIMCVVKFVNGVTGEIIETKEVLMHDDVTAPEAPEVPGYEFYNWRGNMENITCDMTVVAEYSEVMYEIQFVDSFGNELGFVYYFYGDEINYPEVPTYEGYNFVGWDRELTNINDNLVITAVFEQDGIKITFVDKDGNVIKTVIYVDGEVECPEAPEVEGYKFIEWDNDFENITENVEVKPIYKKLVTVNYVYNGEVIWSEEIVEGEDATFGFDVPEVKGYKFNKFSSDGKELLDDTTIELLYKKESNGCNKQTYVFEIIFMLSLCACVSFFFKKK